jgi:hypothetical protein
MIQPPEVTVAKLRKLDAPSLEDLVLEALINGGPQTQSQLTNLIESVKGTPSFDDPE